MSVFFRHSKRLNAKILREAGSNANLTWDCHSITYKKQAIGFMKGKKSDAVKIQDELEKLLGYRPRVVDEPAIDISQTYENA
jgi:hypothetical protein